MRQHIRDMFHLPLDYLFWLPLFQSYVIPELNSLHMVEGDLLLLRACQLSHHQVGYSDR